MKNDSETEIYALKNQIRSSFPTSVLKERYLDLFTFHINSAELKWSEVFAIMAVLKDKLNISDYSITQMSLEQVFLHFTREGNQEVGSYENGANLVARL